MTMTINPTKPPKPRGWRFRGPSRTIELPDGAVPCVSCGQPVRGATRAEVVERVHIGFQFHFPEGHERHNPNDLDKIYLDLVRCSECMKRRALAERVVAQHNLVRVYGSDAAYRVEATLIGLQLAGINDTDSLMSSATDLRLLVTKLASVGDSATWLAALHRGADGWSCAPSPWAHVQNGTVKLARDAYRAAFMHMVELPALLTPPAAALRACLYCGRPSVEEKPSLAFTAWGRLREVDPRVLSLKPRYQGGNVIGCLCRECDGAVGWLAMGRVSVQVALATFLGYEVRPGTRIDGIRNMGAWVSQQPINEPNEQPWGHIDTASVRRGLEKLRGEHVVRRLDEEWPAHALIVGWVNPRQEVYSR